MDRIIVIVILLALISSCDINKNINQNNEPVTTFENNNENPTDNEQIEVENNIVDDKTETKINVVNETINNNTIVKSQTYEGVYYHFKNCW